MTEISTKPYMLRAIHEWCTDSGFTPYIAVSVDEHTIVPPDFVRAGEIVLNISTSATNRLEITNELIQFQARFNGRAQDLSIPVENVSAIYARENGHGMAFDVPKAMALVEEDASAVRLVSAVDDDSEDAFDVDETGAESAPVEPPPPPQRQRPTLTAVRGSDHQPLQSVSDDETDTDQPPDDDGGGSVSDNNDGAPPKRRGKPKLTRVK